MALGSLALYCSTLVLIVGIVGVGLGGGALALGNENRRLILAIEEELPCNCVNGTDGTNGTNGADGTFSGVIADTNFTVVDASDATKQFVFDVQGNSSTRTVLQTKTWSDSIFLTTPNINGTLLVTADTEFVFLQPNAQQATLHGSNSGIQYSSTTTTRPSLRLNQYGANTGIPGMTGFKSRGTSVGVLAPVQAGDVLLRLTAIGVSDNLSIGLGATWSVNVPTGGVPAGQGWVATEWVAETQPLAGPINGRKQQFAIGSEGVLRIAERANSMAGVATTGAGGTVVVANTNVAAATRIQLTIQDGGAVPTNGVYVSARVASTSFTIQMINAADVGVVVYYQLYGQVTP